MNYERAIYEANKAEKTMKKATSKKWWQFWK